MSELQAKIIVAIARRSMNISEAARTLHYHINTFAYHIEKIRTLTGLDPKNFFDLHELYTMACEILGDDYDLP